MSRKRDIYLSKDDVLSLARKLFPTADPQVAKYDISPYNTEETIGLQVHNLLYVEILVLEEGKRRPQYASLYMKALNPDGNELNLQMFEEEKRFFQEIEPEMPTHDEIDPWTAKCYWVTNLSLVMENLKLAHFEKVAFKDFTLDHMRASLRCLGRFHACSTMFMEKLKKPFDQLYPGAFKDKTWVNSDRELVKAIARYIDVPVKYITAAYDFCLKRAAPEKGKLNILCHGDLSIRNMVFSQENGKLECRFINFGKTTHMCYVNDLLQLIYLNLDDQVRFDNEKELIEVYYRELRRCLVRLGMNGHDILTLTQVYKDYEDNRILGLANVAEFYPMSLVRDERNRHFFDTTIKKFDKFLSPVDYVLDRMQRYPEYNARIDACIRDLLFFTGDWCRENKIKLREE